MEDQSNSQPHVVAQPDFGVGVAHRERPVSPRELYRGLFLDLENHVHFIEPAYVFARAALARSEWPRSSASDSTALLSELDGWARKSLRPLPEAALSSTFPAQVARQFAPTGLSDGAWLHGALLSNAVESEVGMRMLKQLMMRFAGPGVGESYVERYGGLLRSLAMSPVSVHHHDELGAHDTGRDVAPLAHEHALLGLTLGLFPLSLGLETIGFNLWMATVGPCPLLEKLGDMLASQGADLRYFAEHDRSAMARLAGEAVEHALRDHPDREVRATAIARIARGFAAAHQSYLRWEAQQLGEDVALSGLYVAPQDPQSLAEYAFARYGQLDNASLYHCFANIDIHPAARLFARAYVKNVFEKLGQVLSLDPRLNSQNPPDYSERALAEIVALQHDKNVRARSLPNTSLVSSNSEEAAKGVQEVFDGCWLQGFVDVQRAGLEECGWLFRIYASEHGDGDFRWNHCQIFRKAFLQLGDSVMLPKTDLRLYQLFEISVSAMVTIAASLNTRHFMPELLGVNLGIEATGVGGSYIDQWREAEKEGNPWRALAWRLHNSIDNYADGHTKWSLSAVQSYMRRVKSVNPERADELWLRVWRLWRCRDILIHGSDEEQAVLEGYFLGEPEGESAAP